MITKHNYDVAVYNYEESMEIIRFRLSAIEEDRREDAELQRALLGDLTPSDRAPPKLGNVHSVSFHDANTIHYSLHAMRGSDICDLFREAADNRYFLHSCVGRYVVVVTEYRVGLYNIVCPSQTAAEVNATQVENKTFLCAEALNSGPLFALGCSDGVVRIWNYESRSVLNNVRITGPHTKGISQLICYYRSRESIYAATPTLFVSSLDGAISAITLSCSDLRTNPTKFKTTITWQIPKAHNDAILSLNLSHETGLIASLSTGGTLVLHEAKNGTEVRRVLPSRKITKVVQAFHAGSGHRVLVLCEHSHVYGLDGQGNLLEYVDLAVVARKKDVHIYAAVVHPLLRNLVFITCNNGLVQVNTNMIEGVAARTSGFGALVGQQVVYAKSGLLHPPRMKMDDTNVAIVASPSQRYYALLKRTKGTVEIYTTKEHQLVPMESGPIPSVAVAWHSYQDTFSVLSKQQKVCIFAIVNEQSISTVALDVVTIKPPTSIIGGRWLCIQYGSLTPTGDDMMQFYKWCGTSTMGGLLPKSSLVLWDTRGTLCALVYEDRVVMMSVSNRTFKMQGSSGVSGVSHGLWYNGTLFVVTPNRVVALFPSVTGNHVDTEELAFLDVAMHYGSIVAHCVEEWTMCRPSVSLRPPGTLEILGVLDGALMLIDSEGTTHSLALSSPALMCKLLCQAGNIPQALAGIERYHLNPDDYTKFLQQRNEVQGAMRVKGTGWATRLWLHVEACDMGAVVRCLQDPSVTTATRIAEAEKIVYASLKMGKEIPQEVLQVLQEITGAA